MSPWRHLRVRLVLVVWRARRRLRSVTDAPIGIFDSGVGGLTVARAILDQLPHEQLLYVGDTAHVPYGPQPIAEVRRYALACSTSWSTQGVKLLVIACNSRLSRLPARRPGALRRTGRRGDPAGRAPGGRRHPQRPGRRDRYHGDRSPAARTTTRSPPPRTSASPARPARSSSIRRARDHLGPGPARLAQRLLEPLQRAGVDTLVLGCTHYPLLAGLIGLVMGDGVTLVSSAEETAKDVYRRTDRAGPAPDPDDDRAGTVPGHR